MNEQPFSEVPAVIHASAGPRRRHQAVARAAKTPAARHDKHAHILRAATRIFARDGFFNAQMADIAREAGVATGTVYLYFRSKDDLLVSIFERGMRDAIAEGREALSGVVDPVARLRVIARQHLDRLGRDRDLAVVFQVELRRSTKHMQEFSATQVREYLGIIRSVIAEGQDAGVFSAKVNPTIAAKIVFGALDEMATNWMLSRRRYSLAADADQVVDLLVSGLCERQADASRRAGPPPDGPRAPRSESHGHLAEPRPRAEKRNAGREARMSRGHDV
jgi:TetR/AcrR family fatty acid metabolism transcriptional regulator